MTYKLKFLPAALKEWKKLDASIRNQFQKKLKERLKSPKVLSAQLSGFESAYKIKLRSSGYRLAYEVIDNDVVVMVLAVGKRDRLEVYENAKSRK
ncbi:MAG: type II toxin-antitoxin system RelE/ParE family toxin [Gammaproteobacteria bacterium]|jgi:mRNA interferase RelE/StbE|nr:type II toxin-antitoxin system RelE/ParE family toxin [Gammaproteobacteria bacterium]MBT4607490.1 type II toxin-antitoxin system RelE/ParE family toxin [Thiotrichales bacterium]MBT3472163.1 type II toxin-antitoxin system RelE/ParE family toxin [Gammaproteobacteria bacterium]MBT3967286.1 type II toxin-antitoxin system RelE/ParE family toxin [Gammaproteobacteria bacterium]MBT4079262.1 type II toxin-antitoxin system RelE/ParE family toxin [Gammaproteobacteria bacterium]